MTQQLTLDLAEGRRLRDEGIAKVSLNRWIQEARYAAAQIAMERGQVTSDDVQERCPLPAHLHVNAWGAVLRAPFFLKVGERQSKRPTAHARWIHCWILNSKDTAWMHAVEASL